MLPGRSICLECKVRSGASVVDAYSREMEKEQMACEPEEKELGPWWNTIHACTDRNNERARRGKQVLL